MFDIGPSELILIFIVALLVIGPEKLPSAVRTAGLWIGRFRRSFHKIKAEVEKELNADEIKRQLHNESILSEVENAKSKAQKFASDIEKAASGTTDEDETDLRLQPQNAGNDDKPNPEVQADTSGDTAGNTPYQKDDDSITGGMAQAVSYVNDISREVAKEVKTNVEEIQAELKPSKKPSPDEKS